MNPIEPRAKVQRALGMMLAAVFLSACGQAAPPPAQTTAQAPAVQDATSMAPTVPPAVSVNALMVSSIDHAGHIIWDAAVQPPKTDNEWLEIEYHGIQLSALATLISLGGSGPADPGWARLPQWKEFAKQMSDEGVSTVGAARTRNLDAIKAIGDRLVVTCEGCHKQFKPEVPTEGLLHKALYPR